MSRDELIAMIELGINHNRRSREGVFLDAIEAMRQWGLNPKELHKIEALTDDYIEDLRIILYVAKALPENKVISCIDE